MEAFDIPVGQWMEAIVNWCLRHLTALFDAIRQSAKSEVEIHEIDANINDQPFAVAMAGKLLEFLSETKSQRTG